MMVPVIHNTDKLVRTAPSTDMLPKWFVFHLNNILRGIFVVSSLIILSDIFYFTFSLGYCLCLLFFQKFNMFPKFHRLIFFSGF